MASVRLSDSRIDVKYPSIFQRYVNKPLCAARLISHLPSYINARSWEDLARALRNTGMFEKNSPEELVHLRLASRATGTPHEVFGTRSVVYKKINDIPTLLRGEAVPGTELNPGAASFAPSIITRPSTQNNDVKAVPTQDPEEDDAETSVAGDEEDAGIDHDVNPDEAAQAINGAHEEQKVVVPTTEETQAVTLIAITYRKVLSRRQSTPQKGKAAELHRLYMSYKQSAHTAQMPSRYRHLYLGPLPLASLCLRTMSAHVAGSKAKARAHLNTVTEAQHSEYEKINAQITNAM